MARPNPSPLRYPGGKTALLPLLSGITYLNEIRRYHYAEPYAGGCGLALAMLYGDYVDTLHLNDIDPTIWSFWHAVLHHNQDIIRLIETAPVNMAEWEKQKEIHSRADNTDPLALGFATFFLNRTNRSGIIKGAGVIGGKSQSGAYKMDCRFNREDLADKIRRIHKYRHRIFLYNQDAIDFMYGSHIPEDTLFFIDPPYYKKGASLYTSFYRPEDHAAVAQAVGRLDKPWLVTYDDVPEIRELYKDHNQHAFNIHYSLQTKRQGSELLISSPNLYLGNYLQPYQVAA